MSKTSKNRRDAAAATTAQPIATETIMQQVRGVLHDIFDPYRPELHYMRGPGPAWRARRWRVLLGWGRCLLLLLILLRLRRRRKTGDGCKRHRYQGGSFHQKIHGTPTGDAVV